MFAELPVAFADVSASALCWGLGLVPAEPLVALDVPLGGHRAVTLVVLGSSHQALLWHSELIVSETVGCNLPAADALPTSVEQTIHGSSYSFRSDASRLDPDALHRRVERVLDRLSTRDDAVVARYPGSSDAITALEVIRGGADDAVGWRTWHAYPQSGELVETMTVVRTA